MALEGAFCLLFVKEPDEASNKPHEKEDDEGEYICFALWTRENVNKKREDGEREQQRGEWVEK